MSKPPKHDEAGVAAGKRRPTRAASIGRHAIEPPPRHLSRGVPILVGIGLAGAGMLALALANLPSGTTATAVGAGTIAGSTSTSQTSQTSQAAQTSQTSGSAPAPLPTGTAVAAVANETPGDKVRPGWPAPTSVQTVLAAGASDVPQTGGVKFVPPNGGPLAGKVIVLDPGHNGSFKSSVNNKLYYTFGSGWRPCAQAGTTTTTGVEEHEISWKVVTKMVPILLDQGATVVMTRADDTGYGPCNNERPEIVNREGASLLLSVHVDGSDETKLRGFFTMWSPRMAGGDAASEASAKAARIVVDTVKGNTALPPSNYLLRDGQPIITRTDLSVLNGVRGAPAVLIETGNSRNPDDIAFLTSDAGQTSLAQALAKAAGQIVTTIPANTSPGTSSPSPAAKAKG